jgi:tetratricopeptide (TPR) repeat protein
VARGGAGKGQPGIDGVARHSAGGGWLAYLQGDLDRAKEASEEGLKLEGVELFRETGDWGSVAVYLRIVLGAALIKRGNFERAKVLFEESLALSRQVGDNKGIVLSLEGIGDALRDHGDHERAIEYYEEALPLCRELDDQGLLGALLTYLGHALVLQGDHERATAVSEEAAAIQCEQGYTALIPYFLKNLARAALLRNDQERAKVLFEESLALCQELGDR